MVRGFEQGIFSEASRLSRSQPSIELRALNRESFLRQPASVELTTAQ